MPRTILANRQIPGAGGALWTPIDLGSKLRVYHHPPNLSLNNNDPVSSFTDHSSNAFHATASGTARPTFTTDRLNGKPMLVFNGTSHRLQYSASQATQSAWALYMVCQVRNSDKPLYSNRVTGGAGNPCVLSFSFNPYFQLYRNNGSPQAFTSNTQMNNSYAQVLVTHKSGVTSIFVNGRLENSQRNSTATGWDMPFGYLGWDESNNTYYNGDLGTVVMCNDILTGNEMAELFSFGRREWAL